MYGAASSLTAVDGMKFSKSDLSLSVPVTGLSGIYEGTSLSFTGNNICPNNFEIYGASQFTTGSRCTMSSLTVDNSTLGVAFNTLTIENSYIKARYIFVSHGTMVIQGASQWVPNSDPGPIPHLGSITTGGLNFSDLLSPIEMDFLKTYEINFGVTIGLRRLEAVFPADWHPELDVTSTLGFSFDNATAYFTYPAIVPGLATAEDSTFHLSGYTSPPLFLQYEWVGSTRFYLTQTYMTISDANHNAANAPNAVPVSFECSVFEECYVWVELTRLTLQTSSSEIKNMNVTIRGNGLTLANNFVWSGNGKLELRPQSSMFTFNVSPYRFSTGHIDIPVYGERIRLVGGIGMNSFSTHEGEIEAWGDILGTGSLFLNKSRILGLDEYAYNLVRFPTVHLLGDINIEGSVSLMAEEMLYLNGAVVTFNFTKYGWDTTRVPWLSSGNGISYTSSSGVTRDGPTEFVVIVTELMLNQSLTYNQTFFTVPANVPDIPVRIVLHESNKVLGDCTLIHREVTAGPVTSYKLAYATPSLSTVPCSLFLQEPSPPVATPTEPQAPAPSKPKNMGLIVGVAVGVPVGLILLITIVVLALTIFKPTSGHSYTSHSDRMARMQAEAEAAGRREVEMAQRGW
jgi:hypothetical protein